MNSVNISYHQVGSYGWVDANGILRVYDYIADDNGYRVTKDSAINLDDEDFFEVFAEVRQFYGHFTKRPYMEMQLCPTV